jgi:hypothetical protein
LCTGPQLQGLGGGGGGAGHPRLCIGPQPQVGLGGGGGGGGGGGDSAQPQELAGRLQELHIPADDELKGISETKNDNSIYIGTAPRRTQFIISNPL